MQPYQQPIRCDQGGGSLPISGCKAEGWEGVKATAGAEAAEKPLEKGPAEADATPLAQAFDLLPACMSIQTPAKQGDATTPDHAQQIPCWKQHVARIACVNTCMLI